MQLILHDNRRQDNMTAKTSLVESLTHKYAVSKTLRFELVPQGSTLAHIQKNNLLANDIKRSEQYTVVKGIIDRYHKQVIEEALRDKTLDPAALRRVEELYFMPDRSAEDSTELYNLFVALRKAVATYLRSHDKFPILFKKDLIDKELPLIAQDDEEMKAVDSFRGFTSYFTAFHQVRENLYSAEEKSTAVAYRLINENLPKFLGNNRIFRGFTDQVLADLGMYMANFTEMKLSDDIYALFDITQYSTLMVQPAIDQYNVVIGTLNQAINLYNQQTTKENHLPFFSKLYKQVLSDREPAFTIEVFRSDEEVKEGIQATHELAKGLIGDEPETFHAFIEELQYAGGEGIFVKNDKSIPALSSLLTGNWERLTGYLSAEYDQQYTGRKKGEKYEAEKKKNLKKVESYALRDLYELVSRNTDDAAVNHLVTENLTDLVIRTRTAYAQVQKDVFATGCPLKDASAIEIIKNYLDLLVELHRTLRIFAGTGLESERNERFYGVYDQVIAQFASINKIYNMVRNYVTKKPFSTEKIKLNFNKATLASGWDIAKESDSLSVLFEKDGLYYLGIMDKSSNRILSGDLPVGEDNYRKMDYKLLPGPNKMLPKVFFSRSGLDFYKPSAEILSIYRSGSFKKGENFSLADCHKLIDFFKASIVKRPEWATFGFTFRDTQSYSDISGFYKEVEEQGYSVTFRDVSKDYINQMVDEGKLYLFKIYNKDFSSHSHGTPNLHTIYWKMLFDPRNLEHVVYKLNGGAEIFYRPASIERKITHPKNQPIKNKRIGCTKKTSVFPYDLIKDKHYTEDKFLLHVPLTMNFGDNNARNFNLEVRSLIQQDKGVNIIGVDRGERNLLSYSVITPEGQILEQGSLNRVGETDYKALLEAKATDRQEARKNWTTIEGIKNIKSGYLSQVLHRLAQLIIKYDAIVVLEDLNFGFKRGRQKVEKQVYQQFEKMLIDKLNYLVDKQKTGDQLTEPGGALNAFQLTQRFESFKSMGKQTGILFYVPAWMTSQIDPTTGFVNLLDTRYSNIDNALAFFGKFDSIRYNAQEGYFEFVVDFSNFTDRADGTRTQWTLCSYGKRLMRYKDAAVQNQWTCRECEPTKDIKALLHEYGISYDDGAELKDKICAISDKDFLSRLLQCLQMVVQIRNIDLKGEKEYVQSCIKNEDGTFFSTEQAAAAMPFDPDTNDAYHIAKKGAWIVDQIRSTPEDELGKLKLAISNRDWLSYAQSHVCKGQ